MLFAEQNRPPTGADARSIMRLWGVDSRCEGRGDTWVKSSQDIPGAYVTTVGDTRYISHRYGRHERRLAYCVEKLLDRRLIDKGKGGVEEGGLGASQVAALNLAARESTLIITGGPGTGKTTIARRIADSHSRVLGLSPTGKGADRLSESLGVECYTNHRATYRANTQQIRLNDYDCVVMDEIGMLDVESGAMIFRYLHNTRAHVILMGDPGQLPPVGPGKVLDDLIGAIPTAHLDISYRCADVDIGLACEAARQGELYYPPAPSSAYSMRRGGPGVVFDRYRELIRQHGVDGVKVITFRRADAEFFNRMCRGITPTPIICTRNDYHHNVWNGSAGHKVGNSLVFGDKRLPGYAVNWQYGYGNTGHRCQGGQWPAVIVWMPWTRYLSREWYLTALSRAEVSCDVIFSSLHNAAVALRMAKPATRRLTLLRAFLTGEATWASSKRKQRGG